MRGNARNMRESRVVSTVWSVLYFELCPAFLYWNSGFLRIFEDFSGLFRFFQDFSGFFRNFQEFSGLFRTFQDFSGFFRFFQDFSGLFRICQDFSGFFGGKQVVDGKNEGWQPPKKFPQTENIQVGAADFIFEWPFFLFEWPFFLLNGRFFLLNGRFSYWMAVFPIWMAVFPIENHHLSGEILHSFCTFSLTCSSCTIEEWLHFPIERNAAI